MRLDLSSLIALGCLVVLLAAIVVTDLSERQIPNRIIVSGLVLALICHAAPRYLGGQSMAGLSWWSPAAGFMVGLAALMPLYAMRACGAGDVKLMAMVGAFIGAPAVLWAAIYTLLAGGVLSLVFLLFRGVGSRTASNIHGMLRRWLSGSGTAASKRPEPLAVTAARLPYGVAIAAGTVLAVIRSGAHT